ncbi:hypothetical protein CIP100275_00034 [Corynebacterium diphtheriae]|uniref:hypothetical protein n=1 Tax=Corynebacterium diphtheriae TaxID=1717 RepID=UPI000246950D|nr:hypothetical protein [Corynebacterium diphtheriae]AEX84380.1 hypothetical protein CDVA01_2116 [Corynebacterium diphtheriae VA01]AWR17017.1 hypothetical protein B11Q_02385 [Corynebacterium diphtheriae]OWX99595.1 hypothetical protein B1A53_04915 [Corynebacterium diphtheriae]CAB0485935.1 hypothetical protein CIP100275_00034 [Corynebacterium diphtheriae]CAB0670430.1 hypothetical protein CIP107577_02320 [Corynebacterium diphtheriae]
MVSIVLSDGDDEWIARIEGVIPIVESLRERTKSVQAISSRSSLRADAFADIDVEAAVWYQLAVSVEHLAFVVDALTKTGTLYPSVYMTVLRTAFVSAVNAKWQLVGDRNTRRKRCLVLKAEGLQKALQACRDYPDTDDLAMLARQENENDFNDKLMWLQSQADSAELRINVLKCKFNQTKVIKEVVENSFASAEDSYMRLVLLRIWRNGSAAAHALSQFALGRTVIQEEPENNRPAVGALVADVEHDIGPAFLGTFMILKTAFDLYDLRRCDPIELLNGSAPSLRQ